MYRILIVEAEAIVGLDLKYRLEKEGYEVAGPEARGDIAVEINREFNPDLILMDIRINGPINGLETAELILQDSSPCIIFLTTYTDKHALDTVKELGASGYIVKPYQEKELLITIELALLRAKLNKKQKEERRQLHTILNSLHTCVIATDEQNKVLYANPQALELLGYNSDEIFNRSKDDIFKKVKDLMYVQRKDKHRIPVDFNVASLKDNENSEISFVYSFQDISVLLKNQRMLELARIQAERANSAKTEFLANMSHELRTPLNSIIGLTELAREMSVSQEQDEYLSIVRRSSHSLLNLINSILDFSKIEAGKLEIFIAPFKVSHIIDDLVEKTALQVAHKYISFYHDISSVDSYYFKGDANRITQILMNLVGNAIKFTSQGEVRLESRILREEGEVAILSFTVTDTGIGIPSDKMDIIFDSFTQLDGSVTRNYGGTGLGLSICKLLLDLMDGQIRVSSRSGKGTVFEVDIPLRFSSSKKSLSVEGQWVFIGEQKSYLKWLARYLQSWGGKVQFLSTNNLTNNSLIIAENHIVIHREDWKILYRKIYENCNGNLNNVMILCSITETESLPLSEELPYPLLYPFSIKGIANWIEIRRSSRFYTQNQKVGLSNLESSSKTILLAEDDENNRDVISRILTKAGYKIFLAKNGIEALNLIENTNFDLIILDIQMPELDGFKTAERIVANSNWNHIPLLAFSGHALDSYKDKAKEIGFMDYITKPIGARDLVRKVREALGSFKSRESQGSETTLNVSPLVQSIMDNYQELIAARDEDSVIAALTKEKDKLDMEGKKSEAKELLRIILKVRRDKWPF